MKSLIEKIRLDHIAKSFNGKQVLKNISLSVNESETVVLLGPSGCGKTTLLKLVNRLIEQDSGAIFIEGKPNTDKPKEMLRRSIGYVIQDTGLLPHLNIRQNIRLAGKISQKEISETKLSGLLELMGLPSEILIKYPNELSGGQQQRIGIARALATEPDIILMDEPFSALDNITRGQLQDDFLNLRHLDSKTILLVTHDIQEAFKLGDRIVLLDQGEIQQYGTPVELLTSPANEKVSTFLEKDKLILSLRTSQHQGSSIYDLLEDEDKSSGEKLAILKSYFEQVT